MSIPHLPALHGYARLVQGLGEGPGEDELLRQAAHVLPGPEPGLELLPVGPLHLLPPQDPQGLGHQGLPGEGLPRFPDQGQKLVGGPGRHLPRPQEVGVAEEAAGEGGVLVPPAPDQALRKFAFAYGAIVLIGVGLAVASEYL